MTLKRVLLFVVSAAVVATLCPDAFGQGPGPLRRTGRFLGMGWGVGNHWKAPGHDSSYYNPYSAHNSQRIGGHAMYGGQSMYGGQMNYQMQGSQPAWSYSQPQHSGNTQFMQPQYNPPIVPNSQPAKQPVQPTQPSLSDEADEPTSDSENLEDANGYESEDFELEPEWDEAIDDGAQSNDFMPQDTHPSLSTFESNPSPTIQPVSSSWEINNPDRK